jgi:hypothetical protein
MVGKSAQKAPAKRPCRLEQAGSRKGGLASSLRDRRFQRKPPELEEFRGADAGHAARLAKVGVVDVAQMLHAGASPEKRRTLPQELGVPPNVILELVRLSDLARVPGIKRIRARRYHDAGVATVEKLAGWEGKALRSAMAAFIETTGFDGAPPSPGEASFSIDRVRSCQKWWNTAVSNGW